MKHQHWLYLFATGLVALSALFFAIHYLIFQDSHHIFLYTLHDIAFLPIEVLLVTIVIHSLLERQNLQQKFEKLNMVIGAFYSEVGTQLLREFSSNDVQAEEIRRVLFADNSWNPGSLKQKKKMIRGYSYLVDIDRIDLNVLRDILLMHEDFLLRILENPVMLEHEAFTDVLRAVFHLTEELKNRTDLKSLPDPDRAHLKGDIQRAYSQMTFSWVEYMQYLRNDYPYLFSLALRLDPFTMHPDPCIRD